MSETEVKTEGVTESVTDTEAAEAPAPEITREPRLISERKGEGFYRDWIRLANVKYIDGKLDREQFTGDGPSTIYVGFFYDEDDARAMVEKIQTALKHGVLAEKHLQDPEWTILE